MKDIDKMSSNELRAEVRVLRPVYEAAKITVRKSRTHKEYEQIDVVTWVALAHAIAAVEALDEK